MEQQHHVAKLNQCNENSRMFKQTLMLERIIRNRNLYYIAYQNTTNANVYVYKKFTLLFSHLYAAYNSFL